MPELAFVAPDASADPVAELATALSEEVGRQDAASLLCSAPPEPRSDRVCVSFGALPEGAAGASMAARTIAVLSAPPGSERFVSDLKLARGAGAAFHVNSAATERLHELGVPARHLQLGYSPAWAGSGGAELGAAAEGPELCLIRDCGGYFDWVRALPAINRGAVVLHERSLGTAPLLAGRHLFAAAPSAVDAVAAALRAEPQRLDRVGREALDFVRGALPLELAAAALIGTARTLVAQPLPAATASTPGQQTSRSK